MDPCPQVTHLLALLTILANPFSCTLLHVELKSGNYFFMLWHHWSMDYSAHVSS